MKKLAVLFVSVGLFSLSSCEKESNTLIKTADDSIQTLTDETNLDSDSESNLENKSSNSSDLLGKWETVGFTMNGRQTMDMGAGVQEIEFNAETVDGSQSTYLTFHDDNTFTAENKDFKMKFTTKMNGTVFSSQTQEVGSVFEDKGKWTKNGDELILTIDGNTIKYKIESLTSSKMTLNADMASLDLGAEEMPEGMEMVTQIYLKR